MTTFLSVTDLNAGDIVRIIGTSQQGPIAKLYSQKIAVAVNGRIAECYPSEVELVPQDAGAAFEGGDYPAAVEAAPLKVGDRVESTAVNLAGRKGVVSSVYSRATAVVRV